MNEKFLKIYHKLDIKDVEQHLLVYGELSGSCESCRQMDIGIDARQCPQCSTAFKYIAFRNIKHHLPKIQKIHAERPEVIFIDYDDFKRILGAMKAEEFLK